MPIPFLNSINLTKNQVENFCVYNLGSDPTGSLTAAGDLGYFWLNTAGQKTLKWWDGTNIRSIIDSTNIGSFTSGLATDLAGGAGGDLPYQAGTNDTTFLPLGTAGQVLAVKSTLTQPEWINQSSITAGAVANALTAGTYLTSGGTYNGSAARTFAVDATDANTASKVVARDGSGNFSAGTITANLTGTASSATNKTGGNLGDILVQSGSGTTSFLNAGTAGQVITSNGASPQYVNQSTLSVGSATTATTATNVAGGANGSILVQSGAGTTGQLAIGASGYILTSNGTTPGWSASIPSTSVSGLAASATTDTTNASNISSGTLGLARLALASGQFYVGDGSNNPAATAKSSIPLSGFGAAGADVAMGGFKITGLADPAAATDAATRGYVDSVAQGLDVKASCLVATTADITLSSPGAISIDNIPSTSFTAGTTRILVRAQNTASQNGIYIWNGSGSAMTRSADANTWDELVSAFTFIEQGDTLKDTGWVCTVDAGTLGTTAVTWSQFSGAGSYTANRGLVLSGTAFNFAQNSDYAVGDLPYATGQTTIGLLPAVATGNALISGGVTTAPSWGKIGLATHVSGTLPVGNGGTGATTFTAGRVLFGNGTSALNTSANLFWDNANNRLGIGTATPGSTLDINAGTNLNLAVGGLTLDNFTNDGVGITFSRTTDDGDLMALGVCDTNKLGLFSREGLIFATGGAALYGQTSEKMRLDASGNLGLGVTPSAWSLGKAFEISSLGAGFWSYGNDNFYVNTNAYFNGGWKYAASSKLATSYQQYQGTHQWYTAASGTVGNAISDFASAKMTLDASGNLGLGVTPSAWKANHKAIQFGPYSGSYGTLYVDDSGNSWFGELFYQGTSNKIYTGTGNAAAYRLTATGQHQWYTDSVGGVAGGTVSLTQAMVLDSSGNLGLGVTPKTWGSAYKALQINTTGAVTSYSGAVILGNNYYANSSGNPAYITAAAAGAYAIVGKAHTWYRSTDATPVADGACTLDPAMTLFSDGNLAIGTASNNGGVCVEDRYILVRSNNAKQFLRLGTDGSNDIYLSGAELLGITGAAGIRFSAGTGLPERLSIKSTGQVNFVGLASDPAGAAGDVYYNSTAKALKLYATDWKTLPRKAVVQGGAGTGTTIAVAHNLNTNNVSVTVLRTTDNVVVFTDVAITDADTVTITFASSVTKADYTITVIG